MSGLRRRAAACALLALVLVLPAACGKKGPPLAPLRPVPARIADLTARRLGSDVFLQFTVPSTNQDGSGPADLVRVEVYGLTAAPLPPDVPEPDVEELLERATLISTIDVRPPPVEEPLAPPAGQEPPAVPSEPETDPASPPDSRPGQGERVTVVESLTPEAFQPVELVEAAGRGRRADPDEDAREAAGPRLAPLVPQSLETAAPRVYMAIGVARSGRLGPLSARVGVPLDNPPAAPLQPSLCYDQQAVTIEWAPPPGARHRVQEPAVAPTLASQPIGEWPDPWRYNVYEVQLESGTPSLIPAPVNPQPTEIPMLTMPGITFGTERCFIIRTVAALGGVRQESEPSAPACVTLRDIFPPAAPSNLDVVAGEGVISLIWEANAETDLAGYLVLRGEAPGETLQPLTPTPIRETMYTDRQVQSGVRYVYAVVAVDTATPPNTSAESNRVEERAR